LIQKTASASKVRHVMLLLHVRLELTGNQIFANVFVNRQLLVLLVMPFQSTDASAFVHDKNANLDLLLTISSAVAFPQMNHRVHQVTLMIQFFAGAFASRTSIAVRTFSGMKICANASVHELKFASLVSYGTNEIAVAIVQL
jgi:hypothetical protein